MVKVWTTKKLGEISKIRMCKRVFANQTNPVIGIPFFKIGTFGKKEDAYISKSLYLELKMKYPFPKKGDVLLSAAGTIGRTVVYDGSPAYFQDSNIVWLDLDHQELCNEFLNYLYQIVNWTSAEGSTISRLYNNIIYNTVVSYPSLSEQQAIAEALSDIDHLIASTEKLIAKKKAIKQGMMQELLTGKLRLPGFTKPWKETTLGSVLKVCHGKSQHRVECSTGKYPILATGGCIGYASGYLCDTPSALIGRKGTIDKPMFMDSAFWCIDTLFFTKMKKGIHAKFIYYLFCMIDWNSYNEASGVPSLNTGKIESIDVVIPEQQEQIAISDVLSEFDKDIDGLISKSQKLHLIKQGMMSELLTGRIRLIEKLAAEEEERKTQPISAVKQDHNEQFDDAVLISAIVNAFYSPKYYLGRKKVQKLLYLARRRQNASTDGFLKKAAGPYNPRVRYRGGEKIAIDSRYITETKSDKGSSFAPGEKIGTALGYASQWRYTATIEWLIQNFRYTSVNDLEVLATIDMAIHELSTSGLPISLESVKEIIRNNREWCPKLQKSFFSDKNILAKIQQTKTLNEGDPK